MVSNNSSSKLKADTVTWPFWTPWSFSTTCEEWVILLARVNDPAIKRITKKEGP